MDSQGTTTTLPLDDAPTKRIRMDEATVFVDKALEALSLEEAESSLREEIIFMLEDAFIAIKQHRQREKIPVDTVDNAAPDLPAEVNVK